MGKWEFLMGKNGNFDWKLEIFDGKMGGFFKFLSGKKGISMFFFKTEKCIYFFFVSARV
jgi:hypothetical protein